MQTNATIDEYEVSADKQRLNLTTIHDYLSRSYWSPNIPRAVVKRAIEGSLCFGVYRKSSSSATRDRTNHESEQVGFARVISDCATFAYLSDVFILEPHRGKGLSKRLMQVITQYPSLQGLRRFMLATKDAHSLYQQFGFTALTHPATMMEILRADVYQTL